MLAFVPRLVEDEEVSRDVDARSIAKELFQRLDEGHHQNAMPVGFRHRSSIRSGVIEIIQQGAVSRFVT